MDYKNITLRELKMFSDNNSHYTFGEVLYSILRLGEDGFLTTVKDLKNIPDKKIYEMICKAKIEESENAI